MHRATAETEVRLELCLEGAGRAEVNSGLPLFDHLLRSMAFHGLLDLTLQAQGDLPHHLVEDVGLALGQAVREALGPGEGVSRYGHALVPMDDALVGAALDLSGREGLVWRLRLPSTGVEGLDAEVVPEFFRGFCRSCRATLHLFSCWGEVTHHLLEAAFKAFGQALAQAVSLRNRRQGIPSLKGVL